MLQYTANNKTFHAVLFSCFVLPLLSIFAWLFCFVVLFLLCCFALIFLFCGFALVICFALLFGCDVLFCAIMNHTHNNSITNSCLLKQKNMEIE